VHYWADLQSAHGFRYYNSIAPNVKWQRVLVLALCLVFICHLFLLTSPPVDRAPHKLATYYIFMSACLMRRSRSTVSQSRYTPQDCFTSGEYQINEADKTVHKVHEGCAMYVLRNSPPAFPTRGFQALLSRRARDSNNYRVSQTTR